MPAVARGLWLFGGVPDRPHVDRQPRAPDLRRHQRDPEGDDRLVAMNEDHGAYSVMIRSGVEDSLLTESQHQSLVVEYNDSASPYPADKTINELFEAQAARTPDDDALRFFDQWLTH